MAGHDIIVVGASTGGIEVLRTLVAGLPAGLPAAVFVVCHVQPGARSILPEILSRAGTLLARHAGDGEPFYPGHIYVAPPDYHLMLAAGQTRLSHGPRENRHRPAIDPLFRSAARGYGPRVIGVVLSGYLHDGAGGLLAVRHAGGLAVVQDPVDAAVADMPRVAAEIAGADYVVAAAALPALLAELVQRPAPVQGGLAMVEPNEPIVQTMRQDMESQAENRRNGKVSVYTCPECGGTLWQTGEDKVVRFSCHVGHTYQGEALLEEQAAALEAALWTAVRTFKEKVVLGRQLAAQARALDRDNAAARFEDEARVAEHYSRLIQDYLLRRPPVPPSDGTPPEPPPAANL